MAEQQCLNTGILKSDDMGGLLEVDDNTTLCKINIRSQ